MLRVLSKVGLLQAGRPLNASDPTAANGRKATYDARGRVSQLQFPGGSLTSHTYDDEGELTSVTEPAVSPQTGTVTATFGYTNRGEIIKYGPTSIDHQIANGILTSGSWDARNAVVLGTVPSTSTLQSTTSYAYDSSGRQVTISFKSSYHTYTDNFGTQCPLGSVGAQPVGTTRKITPLGARRKQQHTDLGGTSTFRVIRTPLQRVAAAWATVGVPTGIPFCSAALLQVPPTEERMRRFSGMATNSYSPPTVREALTKILWAILPPIFWQQVLRMRTQAS